VIKLANSSGIKILLQDRLRVSAVPDCVLHVNIRVLRVLRALIAFETPVLFIRVYPCKVLQIAYSFRASAGIYLDMGYWRVPTVLEANSRS